MRMRSITRFAGVLFLLGLITACSPPSAETVSAELQVEGETLELGDARTELDRQEVDGPRSIYVFGEGDDGPGFGIRYFSGNPVPRVYVNYTPKGADEAKRFECFVPGELSNGQKTLEWKRDDGRERHKTETGEATCAATVEEADGQLHFAFEGVLSEVGKIGEDIETIKASGAGTFKLP